MKNHLAILSIFCLTCFLFSCKQEPKFLGKWKYVYPNDAHIKILTISKASEPDSYLITERYEIHLEWLGLGSSPNLSENRYLCFFENNNCFVFEGHQRYCYSEHSNTISKNEKNGEIVLNHLQTNNLKLLI